MTKALHSWPTRVTSVSQLCDALDLRLWDAEDLDVDAAELIASRIYGSSK